MATAQNKLSNDWDIIRLYDSSATVYPLNQTDEPLKRIVTIGFSAYY